MMINYLYFICLYRKTGVNFLMKDYHFLHVPINDTHFGYKQKFQNKPYVSNVLMPQVYMPYIYEKY